MNTKKIALPFVVVIAMLLAFSSPAAAAVGIGGYAGDKPLVTYETDVIDGGVLFVTDETNSTYTTLNTTYYRGDLGHGQPSEFWNNLTQTIEITGIPDGATIKTARLFNYYTWSTSDWDNTSVPGVPAEADMWFTNSTCVTQKKVCVNSTATPPITAFPCQNPIYYNNGDVQYWNTKGQNYSSKSYDYPSGTFAWDVTSMVTGNGTYTAKITNNDSSPSGVRPNQGDLCKRERFATYGFGLLVVYEDSSSPQIQYWIDEGRDLLYNQYGETSENATTIAPFPGTTNTGCGNLTTVCTASDEWWKDPPENAVSFNNIDEGQSTAKDTYSIAVDEFDVTQELIDEDNFADFQSRGDYFGVCNAFLVVETYLLNGYILKEGGAPQPDPKVNITNLDNGREWAASIDGNFYNLSLIPGVDVNASETLQIVACEELPDHESNCNVTDITATIPGGDHNVNLTLNHYCLNYYPDYPYYTKEQDNWSGPAVMQACIGHYYDPGDVPSQAVLNETGIANNTACNADLLYVDPVGMKETLNRNWMWPISRNYALYSAANTTDGLNYMLHYTCFWQHLGPAPVPAYGDYSNWMVVRGIHTSENPYPQSAGSYDIYGFWINDPNDDTESIGENTYKTVDQWTDEYYLNLTGVRECDDYQYKYVGLFEPPEQPAREVRLVHARPRFTDARTPVMMQKPLMVYGVEQMALERVLEDDELLKIVKAAIDGVNEELVPYDREFAATFAKTTAGEPMLVTDDGGDYYVVPFNVPVVERLPVKKVPVEIERAEISGLNKLERLELLDANAIIKPIPIEPIKVEKTLVVVIVDAEEGSFMEASWVADPVKYLPVSKAEALKLALSEVQITSASELSNLQSKPMIELVHRDASPYYPDWKVTVDGTVSYVSQDGTVSS